MMQMPRLGGLSAILGALVFLTVWLPLAVIAYAVLNLRCCGQSGTATTVTVGGWLVVAAATLVPALLAGLLTAVVAEFLMRRRLAP